MSESTVVAETKIRREQGFRYFIKAGGNIARQDRKTKETVVIAPNAFTPEKEFFYFLDANGNVAKTKRVPRGKKQPAETTNAPAPTAA